MVKHFLLLCCSLVLLVNTVIADDLTASIDRNQMRIGESVQLTLSLQGSADSEPDLSPLTRQFEVVGQNKSSSIQIINGSMNRSTQWKITLMPRQTGMLSIPPIHAGGLLSARIRLNVLPENQSSAGLPADVFLEVLATPQDVYVQQQVLCTVRLFRAVDLTQAQLTEPDVNHATVERLGKDATYKTQRQGRSYVVTERRYVIFPQQHGEMTIPALQFDGRVAGGGGFFMQAGRVLRKTSQPITIHVRGIPALWPATSDWLPASRVQLHEGGLTEQPIHVGDALTRSIRIEAIGLTAAQIPPLSQGNIPDVFRQYPDQATLKNQQQPQGMLGIREEKIALMPTKSGIFRLPAIRLSWWNTSTQRLEVAELPARVLTVLPAVNVTSSPAATTANKHQSSLPPQQHSAEVNFQQNRGTTTQWQGWPMVAALLALGWFLTVLVQIYNSYNRKRQHQQIVEQKATSEKKLRKLVLQACRENNATIVAQTLIDWVRHISPHENISNMQQLAMYLQHQDSQWSAALQQLDECLYGQATNKKAWDGSSIITLLKTWKPKEKENTLVKNNELPLLR